MKPMRRTLYRSDADTARALLARAPFVHLAGVDEEGGPVARTVHGVLVGDHVCFHGAPAGEKLALVGRPVVLWAEEVVAEIPSYFIDPVRACPATTLYESAQVHGVLERIDDLDEKAAVLQALMTRFQPEGGHRPLTTPSGETDPMYAAAVKGILVVGVSLAQLEGKSKLAQNRTPDELVRLLDNMWQRGHSCASWSDVRAIELVLEARARSSLSVTAPAFLASPVPGVRLRAHLDATFADEAAALLADAYWNAGVPRAEIARAHTGSSAWVGAVDADGVLVASARAISDGAKWAGVYDVVVCPELRGRGLGRALVRLLLDHPAVRGCRKVFLRTRDAQGVYAKLGFLERPSSANPEMVLVRR